MPRDAVASVSILLLHYSFDLEGHTVEQIAQKWLEDYPAKWVIAAVIEAIFQGRYKVASVEKFLLNWSLNGRPQNHFDSEFADLVCNKLFKAIPPSLQPINPALLATLNQPAQPSPSVDLDENLPAPTQVTPIYRGRNQGISRWLKLVTQL